MSHYFYAQIEEKQFDVYYNAHPEDRIETEIEGYKYSKKPSIGVKVIRDSSWLPDYLVDAVYQIHTPEQTLMYSEMLTRKAGGYVPEDEGELRDLKRIIQIAEWMRYWAHQDIEIRGSP